MTGKVIPLSQTFPEQKPDQVTTYDLLSSYTLGWRVNPDQLVGRHGLAIYSKMSNDEQVKAVLNFKRDAITARGWQFVFDDSSELDEEEQEDRSKLFAVMVQRMRGSFADALNAIMTGRAFGFSITEKVYGQIEVDDKSWPGINMLLGRDPISFRFYTDEYGVLKKIEQQTARAGLVEIDPKRVIHYVHAPEWDHVYGRSDLREAYRSWYIKDQISNLWPMYLERFAGGFLHASLAADATLTSAEFDALNEALKKAKGLGSMITPPGVTLNVIHPPGSPDAYERAMQFHDLAIAKALLVPNLLGISQASGGSYAQSQTQLEAFFWTLNADAVRLEECLNEQLFRDLGDQAWGDGEYPLFKFKPASVEHAKWIIGTWQGLIGAGAVIPTEEDEAFLRRLLEMPARDEDDKTIAQANAELAPPPPQPAPGAPGDSPSGAEGGVATDTATTDDGEEEDGAEPAKKTPVGKGELREFARMLFAEWDESKHPRAKDGKFAPGDGGESSGSAPSGKPRKDPDLNPQKGDKTMVRGVNMGLSNSGEDEDADFSTADARRQIADTLEEFDIPRGYAKYVEVEGLELQDKIYNDDDETYDWHYSAQTRMPAWLDELIGKRNKELEEKAAANEPKGHRVKGKPGYFYSADWDESKHPRDSDGRWTYGEGGDLVTGTYGDNSKGYLSLVANEVQNLGPELLKALDEYSDVAGPGWRERDALIENAIKSQGMALPSGYSVYRGLELENEGQIQELFGGVGSVLQPMGLQSVSVDRSVAETFATLGAQGEVGIVLDIVPEDGVKVLPVPMSGQSELVMSKGVKLITTGKPRKVGRNLWKVTARARSA